MSSKAITCFGTGNMGAAIAHVLLQAKTSVTVWNRTADRPQVAALVEAGANFEPNVGAAIDHGEIIILCVLDYEVIYQIFHKTSESNTFEGKTIVNLTNGTPLEAREMALWAKSLGAKHYFDGGVMVTPQLVGTTHAFILLSGEDESCFSEGSGVPKTLSALGKLHYVSPDVGAAAAQDLAGLAAMYGMFYGAFVGMGLLKKQKATVDGQKTTSPLVTPAVDNVVIKVLQALVPYLHVIADATDKKAWSDDMGNPLAMQLAGVGNIVKACKDEGVDCAGMEVLQDLMQKAVDDSWGNGGVAVVGTYMINQD